jgi:hypothetical protein
MNTESTPIAAWSATNRAKITNDPRKLPGHDGRKREGRRRRDLVAIYLDAIGGRDAVTELQLVEVRKAAELTAAAESVRARVLAGDVTADLAVLVKIEGEARRAVRALGIKGAGRKPARTLAEHLANRAAARTAAPSEAAA